MKLYIDLSNEIKMLPIAVVGSEKIKLYTNGIVELNTFGR
jgi:hypothetical protein